MNEDILKYHNNLPLERKEICDLLFTVISQNLPGAENKLWHGHPVWFIEGNPIVGYSSQKSGIKLMFWSGASFNEADLEPGTGKFKDAGITYTDVQVINSEDIKRWLDKSEQIQWDYKNIVKRKGKLQRLK